MKAVRKRQNMVERDEISKKEMKYFRKREDIQEIHE
jgi:hypothetical protein